MTFRTCFFFLFALFFKSFILRSERTLTIKQILIFPETKNQKIKKIYPHKYGIPETGKSHQGPASRFSGFSRVRVLIFQFFRVLLGSHQGPGSWFFDMPINILQENTSDSVLFRIVAVLRAYSFTQEGLHLIYLFVKFVKFYRISFLQKTPKRLLRISSIISDL